MILPETMTKVEIIAPKSNTNKLVTKLLSFKEFEPEEPTSPISSNRIEEARRDLGEANEHINKLKILMELGGIIIEPKGKMTVNDWIEVATSTFYESSEIENKYKDLLEEIGRLKAELESLNVQLAEIEPFKEIGIDLKLLYSSTVFEIALAVLNERQKQELEQKGFVVIAEKLRENTYACLIIGKKGSKLDEVLKEIGVRRFETPDLISPQVHYNNLKERADHIQQILTKTREELSAKIKDDEEKIKQIYGKLLTVRDAMNILSKARVSDYYIQVQGYVPERSLKKLSKEIDSFAFLEYEYPKRYGEQEEPPTYVSLPKSVQPLESVIEFYGTPSYWEISPTIFLIITFPFLFGLMFPDFGNALVLLLFSIWFYNYGKKKGSENTVKLSLVLIYSSIVAMITGILAREFFGPLPVGGLRELLNNPSYPVGPLYYAWPVPESVYEQVKYILPTGGAQGILNTIILSLFLGSILLFVSTLLGVVNAVKKKDKEYLLYDRLPLFIIYIVPFIVFLYGFLNPANFFNREAMLLGGISYFIFHTGSPEPSSVQILADILVIWVEIGLLYNWAAKAYIAKKHEHASTGGAIAFGFIEGGFEGALLLLSNTISFIRVLVFAIAHYYILYAFSYMAYLAAGSPTSLAAIFTNPAAIVIIIIGNLLAIALEGLIVFIQDMRLHFYEMFSKFYEGRGRKFEPVMAYVELTE